MDSTGWAVIIGAACVGVGGIIVNVATLIIGYFDRRRIDAREEAKLKRLDDTAAAVERVRVAAIQAAADVAKKVENVKSDLIDANGTLKTEIVQAVANVVQQSPDSKPKDG